MQEMMTALKNFKSTPESERRGKELVRLAKEDYRQRRDGSSREIEGFSKEVAHYITRVPVSSMNKIGASRISVGQVKRGSGGTYIWDSKKNRLVKTKEQKGVNA